MLPLTSTAVTLSATAVASAGIGVVQFPFAPVICCVYVSPAAIGMLRGPTVAPPDRVSKTRQGAMGV